MAYIHFMMSCNCVSVMISRRNFKLLRGSIKDLRGPQPNSMFLSEQWTYGTLIDDFRVPLSLSFKASLSAKFLLW